jgi:hypothetical protein
MANKKGPENPPAHATNVEKMLFRTMYWQASTP